MNITRRSFFKIIGATAIATAVPSIAPAMKVVEEGATIDSAQTVYGFMREIVAPDISGQYVVHHDIYDGKNQWGIGHKFYEINDEVLDGARKLSADMLGKDLEKSGVRVADLKKVPDFSSGPIRLRL